VRTLPKFGVATNPSVDVLKEIKTIAGLGFDFVEICIEGPEGKPEILLEKKKDILSLLGKYKIFAIAHTSWWVELGSEYESVRNGWLEECKKAIEISSELGLRLLNLHSTSMGLYFRHKHKIIVLNNLVESLRQLVEYSKKYGVGIMLENVPPGYGISGLKDFKYIVDRVPELKVHLDIGHTFVQDGMKNVERYIKTFKDRIEHIHIHDNYGKRDDHLPVGRGRINFVRVVKMLKKINYDKTITLEVFTSKKDAMKSREKIKKLWMKK